MAEPFLSEIRIMSFIFPPKGWALCNGQLLPINQNQALFSLLGTTYGGDGRVNFALPDLRGRVPIHMGDGHTLGEKAGSEAVTISQQTMPQHIHFMQASTNLATLDTIAGNLLGKLGSPIYSQTPQNLAVYDPVSISNVGGNQPHTNMQPFLVLSYCIALQGIFPSQT
jgi:microcystin-dependent protein